MNGKEKTIDLSHALLKEKWSQQISAELEYNGTEELMRLSMLLTSDHIILLKIFYAPNAPEIPVVRSNAIWQALNEILPKWTRKQIEKTYNELRDEELIKNIASDTSMSAWGNSLLEGKLTKKGNSLCFMLEA